MNVIEARLAYVMLEGHEFTADDVTANGRVTAAGDHDPNAKQNSIGSVFNKHARDGHIMFTGRVVRSKARHRKGGMIRVWEATESGKRWARKVLA